MSGAFFNWLNFILLCITESAVLQNETNSFPIFADHYKYHDFIPANSMVTWLFSAFLIKLLW